MKVVYEGRAAAQLGAEDSVESGRPEELRGAA